MTTIRCQAVLFDMDGVLVDSTDAVRAWEQVGHGARIDPQKSFVQLTDVLVLLRFVIFLPDGTFTRGSRSGSARKSKTWKAWSQSAALLTRPQPACWSLDGCDIGYASVGGSPASAAGIPFLPL